ncbi:MAG TPA: hypothetical protein VFJ58_04950 [Armatimonadota bacterium]|nr:hypothetical protein [Armatimonadota bacterium]
MTLRTRHSEASSLAAQSLAEQAARDARWAYLLEGVRSPRARALVAQLLDNQVRAGLYEDDTTADIPTFTTIALAFVPKVYPALLINAIASVQPMAGPTAKVFFEDFVPDFSPSSTFTHGEAAALADATTAPTITPTGTGSAFLAGTYNVGYTFVNAIGETRLSTTAAVTLTTGQNIQIGAITLPTGATGVRYYVSQASGSIVLGAAVPIGSNGAQTNLTSPGSSTLPPGSNTTSPALGEGANIPKTRYKLTSSTVTAQKFALQVQWTTELQEDLRAQYNQDLQSKVFDYVARELVGNIDYTALNTIYNGIPGGNQVSWSQTAASGWTQKDWNASIYGAIVEASLAVEKARFRHPNYIVASPAFAARLEKLETFKAVGWPVGRDDEMQTPGEIGTNVFGSISGRWTVYRTPWISDGTGGLGQAFVGIHGEGFIYAPYIPIQLGPVLPIPGTDELARTMRTRAGMLQTVTNSFASVAVTA